MNDFRATYAGEFEILKEGGIIMNKLTTEQIMVIIDVLDDYELITDATEVDYGTAVRLKVDINEALKELDDNDD